MNYLREINAFYDWLETNSISDSAIALWHALMHINNKAGWITEFAVAISTLETKTGLKKDAINRARNRLQQMGRIEFKSRSGQLSALYTIKPFGDCGAKNETNRDTNRDTNREQTATQTTTQTASIIKLNETKKRIKPPISPFEDYTPNEVLRQRLKDYIEMRKKIGKPMTDRAIELRLKDLDKLAETDELKIAILEQSIANSWQGIFPLKEDTRKRGGQKTKEDKAEWNYGW